MKINIFAYAVFIILVVAILCNSFFISKVTKELAEDVDKVQIEDIESATEKFESLFNKFRNMEKYISLTVSHDDLTNIEESFSEIIGAAKAKDSDALTREKSRLKDALLHLGRLSGINPGSIF